MYVLSSLDTITHSFIAISSSYNIFSCSIGLITKVCTFNLILSFFVSWWGFLNGYIPSMIVYVSGITSCICCLWIGWCGCCVEETLSYVKSKWILLKFTEVSSHTLTATLIIIHTNFTWCINTLSPLRFFSSQEISINFMLNNFSNNLCFWPHMSLSVKESMLR